ncbi:aminoglycoside phosphotransferase [Paenibacillus selenitireducens]|uniref:Aminoglycoside phosphotransferase n=1 Tax=Paenibacillus selenitireducens TaxID=1324314 RepID=A0A1T2XCC1_9BACL|nr:phosphotransferase [Paenibacillus selenitireducens]OPA77422.1 aminoglycoside phosphotransferase [Paenibacillus selenitireducens]
MKEYQEHIDPIDLQTYAKHTFGANYVIHRVSRMHGGAQKVVYKVEFTNHFICVLYVWDLTMSYFQEETEDTEEEERSYGSTLFVQNNSFMLEQGIRTPALYFLNKEQDRYPFDFAFVEYIDGKKAEAYFGADSIQRDTVLYRLSEMLYKMHDITRTTYGKWEGDSTKEVTPCHRHELNNAFTQLSYVSQYMDDISTHQGSLIDWLYELESNIQPRDRYGYIHGELGPDHIMVGENLEPYLIDIEGAMFYDIEHEHSFLEFRFGDFYRYLKREDLDPNRMQFYRLHHHISCASGGLKLLHRGYPNQGLARDIAEYNSQRVMQLLRERAY